MGNVSNRKVISRDYGEPVWGGWGVTVVGGCLSGSLLVPVHLIGSSRRERTVQGSPLLLPIEVCPIIV